MYLKRVTNEVLYEYKNGNHTTILLNDGTKVTTTQDDEFTYDFAESHDIHISNKCTNGCKFCYAGCSKTGKVADWRSYKFWDTMHEGTEVSFNFQPCNDDDLVEDFYRLLVMCKDKHLVANLTVHADDFMKYYKEIKNWAEYDLVHGIGISLNEVIPVGFIEKVRTLPNAVIHVIYGVVDKEVLNRLANQNLKLLILGYKDIGRGTTYNEDNAFLVYNRKEYLYKIILELKKEFAVLSFDCLAVEQLDLKKRLSKEMFEQFYQGEDGTLSFYLDLVKGTFSRSSVESDVCFDITDNIDDMFNVIKGMK